MNYFSLYHPAITAFYFLSVFTLTMFNVNPLILVIALIGGVLFFIVTKGHLKFFKEFCFYILLFIIISLTNPLFSHNGVTTLFFLNSNPITLEALLYGVDIAVMLIAVMYWFKCFNLIMTEDKILYLFGKFSPRIALLISTVLRFIPLLKTQSVKIRQTQKAMGLLADDTWTNKLKGTLRVYSALITWALENAIDTGSSMKARGYGLKNRSYYSLFSFKKTDFMLFVVIVLLDIIIISVMSMSYLEFTFYPEISAISINFYNLMALGAFALLSFLPFILEVKERLLWKYYRSKI